MIKIAKVEKLYKSPGPQPNGLQAAEDGLWCIDQGNMKVYRSDWETGEVLFEADTDTEHSSGITLGGGYLWVASTFELKIAKLGWKEALKADPHLAEGLNVHEGKVTYEAVATELGHEYRSAAEVLGIA